jgi:hypothetical protein
LTVYDFDGQDELYEGIACVYYAFTSLSTVGFGDYEPKSDAERLLCSVILVLGVCVFSCIMEVFLEVISNLQSLSQDLDDGDNLTRFFGVMKRYNGGKNINHDLKEKMEVFFDYKWNYDKLMALDDDEEKAKLS